jgi:NADH:ubiquinone oxidoreductase subunit E
MRLLLGMSFGKLPGMPSRKAYLLVCTNRRDDAHPRGSCAAKGSEALLKALKAELATRNLSTEFRACGATCLDACEFGAAVLMEPGHRILGSVTEANVKAVVDTLVAAHAQTAMAPAAPIADELASEATRAGG